LFINKVNATRRLLGNVTWNHSSTESYPYEPRLKSLNEGFPPSEALLSDVLWNHVFHHPDSIKPFFTLAWSWGDFVLLLAPQIIVLVVLIL
jgi:hypothetical protein